MLVSMQQKFYDDMLIEKRLAPAVSWRVKLLGNILRSVLINFYRINLSLIVTNLPTVGHSSLRNILLNGVQFYAVKFLYFSNISSPNIWKLPLNRYLHSAYRIRYRIPMRY